MTNTKHVPGPYIEKPIDRDEDLDRRYLRELFSSDGKSVAYICANNPEFNLFAAAPELLAACQEAVLGLQEALYHAQIREEVAECSEPVSKAESNLILLQLKQIQDAIAKARGD
jgi:hypothetical protein